MQITDIQVLTLHGYGLGLRIQTNEGVFDADKESLRKIGVYNLNIGNESPLKQVGDLLMTEEEEQTNLITIDISEDTEKLVAIREAIENEPKYKDILLTLQMPHQLTLAEFMYDESWLVTKVNRTDEYKNQHDLLQPDGKMWRGGWIGSNRTREGAKRNFHKEQVMWAIHRGETITDNVLADYPDHKQTQDKIEQIKQTMTIVEENFPILVVEVDNEQRTIPLSQFPKRLGDRIEQRQFVREYQLVSKHDDYYQENSLFTLQELTVIALYQVVRDFLKEKQEVLNY